MNIRQIMMNSIKELSSSATPKLDVELILCKVLDVDRLYLHINLDEDITKEQETEFYCLLNQRKEGRPIAYILGHREFMGLDFFVKEGVLIPRPDTEILIEEVINLSKSIKSPLIVDIGTGSGAISVSLAKYIKDAKVYSLDISDTALEVGKINAKNNNVEDRITFLKSDLFSSVENLNSKFDIVVSNPPYIKKDDIYNLDKDVKDYEPILALDGGEDGLNFYRRITKDSLMFLKENGVLAYEVGHDQAEDVKEIMIENNFKNIKIVRDLAGIQRVVIGF
ncbi:peptide chain release factor N(5)-glutamine methyltransferase [Tepidibacter formicigenes]|uniref:Release factor glutamine methyltransferase n=1 Tax=Tepidibacter formicigenes DSM 15518 TaxID=1123349 RepID=A0A1M6MQ31_9FIRM|nr:peptide chain release factor N(5)-glutamine methyltransferase [Tepidibacter formicigenes]SHJ85534.1 release factor glutamine methyltransferase [Tepidibacter formicigenes DSM 15518]